MSLKYLGYFRLRNSLPLWILLLLFSAQEIKAGSNTFVVDRTVAACKMPRIPLLCDSKILLYAYNETTGQCVSLYTSGCIPNVMTEHFLTFEECRRDRMQILRY